MTCGEGRVQVQEEGKARAVSTVTLVREVDAASGATLLRLSCALWVYNCSGLPIALQRVPPPPLPRSPSHNCIHTLSGLQHLASLVRKVLMKRL